MHRLALRAVTFSLLLSASSLALAADTPPIRPGIAVWDTTQLSETPLTPSALMSQNGWTSIPVDKTAASLKGDAVMSNGRILAVARKRDSAIEMYAAGANGVVPVMRVRIVMPQGEPAERLDRLAIIENTKAAACLEVTYKTAKGTDLSAKFRVKRGEVSIQAEPGSGAGRLRVECPSRFVVLPDFFADDIVVDARKIPLPMIELPSENFLLHLSGKGDTIGMCVFENRQQDVNVTLTGTGDDRAFTGSEIGFEGKKVWLAALHAPQVWHSLDVKSENAGKVTPLDWKMPFPAQWRFDFTKSNELTDSWEMLLQEKKGYLKPSLLGSGDDQIDSNRKRWNTVLGTFPYPCWSDQEGKGYVQPLKHKALTMRGPAVVYPLSRVKQTPLDAYTVVDVMRNTLGVGPCEHILDLEGQKAEYKGRATCSVRDKLGDIYGKNQQKQKRSEVDKTLDEGLAFVTHIRVRISRYVEFGHKLRDYLAEQKKAHPELAEFITEMDKLTQEIDSRVAARVGKIQTPAHVAQMNEEFRKNVLDYDGADALERCKQYTKALVVIGDNQDELSGECRYVVKALRQRAGILMALDPKVAPVAGEIRARTQEALRNPANHEGARH